MEQGRSVTLTNALLAYLFANHVVPARTIGTRVLCENTKVQTTDLASALCAITFQSLRDYHLVQLSLGPVTRGVLQRLVGERTRIWVVQSHQANPPGLDGLILRAVSDGVGCTIYDIIRRCIGTDHADPWQAVLRMVEEEAIACGYVDAVGVESGGKGSALSQHRAGYEPNCRRIATLEQEFVRFSTRWQSFRANEPTLYKQLLLDCRFSIASCIDPFRFVHPV